jgi:hypothetical protein
MFVALQVLATMLVALAAALSVAHALEFPGKLRLDKDTYLAVQRIYYPGFTVGGVGEVLGTLLTLLLVLFTPFGSVSFWLTLAALVAMIGVIAIYWLVTHPVNQHWVKGETMNAFASGFFRTGARRQGRAPNWRQLRDVWEYSHVARAVLASASLLALVLSLALRN